MNENNARKKIEQLESQISALEQLLEVQERTVLQQAGRLEKALEELYQRTEELERSEKAFQQQTRILESILASMSEGVVVADETGKFLVFNPAAERMVGIGKINADPGQWPKGYGVFHPNTTTPYPFNELPLVRAIQGEECDEVELYIRNPKVPEGVLISVSGRPVRDEQGTLKKGVIVFHDITERKRAEEVLKRTAAELARSNTELEQFAYVASHDLQEPLRMVASFTTLLERRYKGKLDADADEFIAHAVNGAKRMQVLINDLLRYSRVTTQERPIQPADSAAALNRALANLKIAMEETGTQVTRDSLPGINADPTQLTRLFQNLISNAIKFRRSEPPRIHVSAWQEQQKWIFSVRDNGIGIAPEHADRIFLIFQRLHTRSEYAGTGIGLAICKKIVERHGGEIWVESQPGKGSVFSFTIPFELDYSI